MVPVFSLDGRPANVGGWNTADADCRVPSVVNERPRLRRDTAASLIEPSSGRSAWVATMSEVK